MRKVILCLAVATVRALAGEAPITDKLPIGLPGPAERGAGLTRLP